ncbi:lysine transporter LysE [Comamonas serinivorans]|uniref:Lysine transporter LysE n=1 Tax=Comamonas serinivorans TaxID=1082851 RepID=A0A1Y0ELI3_9BURK|nr:LysE family transporter [Comamonas serinivorans]ARU04219.1 lysine transporter LysE [Comamonas serinivorans]
MDWLHLFVPIALAHFLALLSPGPDFFLLVKTSLRHSARVGLGAALGIAMGNAVYIGLCLVGVGALLSRSVPLMIGLKLAGGLFLMWLGWKALRARRADYAALAQSDSVPVQAERGAFVRAWAAGLASALLNPKNLLFYLSLFTVVLTPGVGLGVQLGLGVWMTAVVLAWDAAIVLLLAKPVVRRRFARMAFVLDKLTGLVLGGMGTRIVQTVLVPAKAGT